VYTVIWDLDGTLADNRHRLPFLRTSPVDWVNYNAGIMRDAAHLGMVALWHVLAASVSCHQGICTSRNYELEEVSRRWLAERAIYPDFLLMRLADDHRPDAEVKQAMVQQLQREGREILLAIEDRPSVVLMYRQMGIDCLAADDTEWTRYGEI
jgi:hypothetical protein